MGVRVGDVEGMFGKVGRGLRTDWRAEAEVLEAA
jgi:hypothetical protein